MAANRLKLNNDKSEVMLCGSKLQAAKVSSESVTVGDSKIKPCDSVRDLGLLLDSRLTLQNHVTSTVWACHFHLRTLRKLRPLLPDQAVKTLAVNLILSRLDYCISCLWGQSRQELRRLKLVQNTAARIVTRTSRRQHISPVLKTLHWLPVERRIDYKVQCLAYACFNKTAPKYLQDLVQTHVPARPLRSSAQSRLRIPSADENHQKKSLGRRAFSNAAPLMWNSLPQTIRESRTKMVFRSRLKTHLFTSD